MLCFSVSELVLPAFSTILMSVLFVSTLFAQSFPDKVITAAHGELSFRVYSHMCVPQGTLAIHILHYGAKLQCSLAVSPLALLLY